MLLHQQNQARFSAIEAKLEKQGETLVRIDANTKGIPTRVKDLEDNQSKMYGVVGAFSFIVAGWELFREFFKH